MLQALTRFAALLALAIFLSACSMSFFQRLIIWGTDFTLLSDVSFGDDPRQKLAIYTPSGAKPRATIVFSYGGSWKTGDKNIYRFLGQALASRGYQLVVADYRLYPGVRYPVFVEDTARAIAWTHDNIATYGGDPSRILLMGHSAGGYNVAMVALDPAFLAPYDLTPQSLVAVAALAGPVSFNPLKTESTKDIFAPAADSIDAARPVRVAVQGAAGAPPMLLMHGTADDTVNVSNSQHLAEAINAHGGTATLKLYPGVGHLGIVTCFAWPLRWKASCLEDVDLYFQGVLAQRSAVPKP